MNNVTTYLPPTSIAIIGMSGRFPGADTLEQFWSNLRNGIDCVTWLTDEELLARGVDPRMLQNPAYVRASATLSDIACFDAEFFGFSPREAEILDPQHRLFMECAWAALESAAIVPRACEVPIGIFAGAGVNGYLHANLSPNPDAMSALGALATQILNNKDFLATQLSYKLNLRGPSISVGTACSTSLVAVHLACQSLLAHECDIALAGGVALSVPHGWGYIYQSGGILSADGRCRPFDAQANGTVAGSGVGVVVLKRLEDAMRDRDNIRAIVRGSAVNNDGAVKVGFSAPSIRGQAEVIASAQAMAEVEPDSITYIEAHGTGTPMGDPVEVAALSQVFRERTRRKGFCVLGSVKSNIGHLDAAAGVAGLIKTVLTLENRELPPMLHFESPNPELDLGDSPFRINACPEPWTRAGGPRRAGVSSFGIGGTNAHIVLEEAPPRERPREPCPWQLLVLSARSPVALGAARERLAGYLETHPDVALADVAHTLQVGRTAFDFRSALAGRSYRELIEALREPDRHLESKAARRESTNACVFMFPGQGAQYPAMGRELYRYVPSYRNDVDRCSEQLRPHLGVDLRQILGIETAAPAAASLDIHQTRFTQPALFVVEYALARLWMALGIQPRAMLGHSVGELVAACLGGTIALPDALRLVALRGAVMQKQPPGRMLAIHAPWEAVASQLPAGVSLSGLLGPRLVVVGGDATSVAHVASELKERGIPSKPLVTSHAFHSHMMDPAVDEFLGALGGVPLRPPAIPFISNVTGRWITPEQATDPRYWAQQLRAPVNLLEGLQHVLAQPSVFLEIGPGETLGRLAKTLARASGASCDSLSSLPRTRDDGRELEALLLAIGRAWTLGVDIQWSKLWTHGDGLPVDLPAYPFELNRHWIEARHPGMGEPPSVAGESSTLRRESARLGESASPDARRDTDDGADALQESVKVAIHQTLGIEGIRPEDDFFSLGGTSLLAPQFLIKLRELSGCDIPIGVLFSKPRVSELAAVIRASRTGLVPQSASEAGERLSKDAKLDHSFVPRRSRLRQAPSAIFLTGATGFLGSFLLAELLRTTEADIHCLVRAETEAEAKRRIEAAPGGFKLHNDPAAARIHVVLGDLSLPRFGLAEGAFERLGREMQSIYHTGALVNFTFPYEALKPSTVRGTEEVLRLATCSAAKEVHHVSSLAVYSAKAVAQTDGGREWLAVPHPEGLDTGYAQSKWVAEQLVVEAGLRGLPVAIYRPALIAGDSQSGVLNDKDFIWNLLAGCVGLGVAPSSDDLVDLVPVDFVASAIVNISRDRSNHGRAYHFISPTPLRLTELFRMVQRLGYPMDFTSFPQWRALIRSLGSKLDSSPIAPFRPLVEGGSQARQMIDEAAGSLRFRCDNTLDALSGTSIACPTIDATLLDRYMEFLRRAGVLPSAAGGLKA